ncbi:MAG TPA: zinc-dependent metalloprotease family protein [Dokdonella sp.]|uniref:reprolysin-like metallopeptidase n=1 Tax=Dokdonella sp. TaxID=2291710 RepID=UPI0025BB7B5B|nr:zinc-dependent metalloprotease family protein [Dokdonella sp.]MBX3692422.1 hypothetical protein [Dokdonella sp.]MCW5566678.1 hypothetical protein [Dokdonella sp.]HNR92029.1 zinc-dependent metalloprotease family protein [Dokdonella sp.]
MRSPVTGFVVLLSLLVAPAVAFAGYWQDVAARAPQVHGEAPSAYRQVSLDWPGLRQALAAHADGVGATLTLPAPDGGLREFVLADSGVMPAELQARFPAIRSYLATDARGTTARVGISMLGLHATVHDRDGIWLVRPERSGMGSHYLSFRRADAGVAPPFKCRTHGHIDMDEDHAMPAQAPGVATVTGTILRNYRAAFAANHHWVQAVASAMDPPQAPSVAIGLAAVVNVINRINEVYGQDFAIRMTLIPNNDAIIYPFAEGDPYSNDEDAIDENGPNLNAVIGSANYDIGHVFTTGSGGLAGLGVVCRIWKADGTTGLPNGATLQTDVFYIDYVAHEVGHQFGGDHTYNSCDGDNAGESGLEPGSGSTIQAYAGICGSASDLQTNSDPYFHARSLQEMGGYSSGIGGSCAQATPRAWVAPTVVPGSATTIPAATPYVLTAQAGSSAPGAVLTYTWEQYDAGPANMNLAVDPGAGPIQRSWLPTMSPRRYLPRIQNLVSGVFAKGEILPTTNRTLNYRLTVRDNLAGGGATNSADRVLTVVDTAGPFVLTAPAAPTIWTWGETPAQTIAWNVAATDQAPISCSAVDIDLVVPAADNSELLRLAVLQTGVPNSGSATVTVPNVSITAGHVRVACSNNIFFNISPQVTVIGGDSLFADGFDSP